MDNNDVLERLRAAKEKAKSKKSDTSNVVIYSEFKNCPLCKGTLQLEDGSSCKCRKKLIINNLMKECGVPPAYYNVNYEFYEDMLSDAEVRTKKGLKLKTARKVYDISYLTNYIKLYAETFENRLNDGRGFILSGNCGGSKTGTSILLIKDLIKKHYSRSFNNDVNDRKYSFHFIEANELLDTIKDTWDNESETRFTSKEILSKIKICDLLVIDDIGAEYSKNDEWLINIFLKLLKGRKSHNKPTIITTNYSPEQLVEWFSEEMFPRLSSVLTESMEVIIIDNAEDVRDRIAESRSLVDDMRKEIGD